MSEYVNTIRALIDTAATAVREARTVAGEAGYRVDEGYLEAALVILRRAQCRMSNGEHSPRRRVCSRCGVSLDVLGVTREPDAEGGWRHAGECVRGVVEAAEDAADLEDLDRALVDSRNTHPVGWDEARAQLGLDAAS